MLDSLHIKNFRCFEDLTIPSLGRVNLIVGKNNSGKSTLLEAIMVYAQHGKVSSLQAILTSRNEFFGKNNFLENIFFDGKITDSPLKIGDSENKNNTEVYFNNNLLLNDWKNNEEDLPFSIINTQIDNENTLADKWDIIYLNSEEETIKEALQILNADITNIVFVQSPVVKGKRIAVLKIKGKSKATPLKAMGEGMSRVLQIFIHAFQAKNGFLLIDEFENGLHYSIQEEVWKKLFKLAKELNIQVFATTHSEDTVKAFCKVSLADEEVDGKLISLGRSAAIADNGKILADVYDEKTLAWIVQSGMEVR
ncbi:AAA family ATPase [Thiothrix fructosivorans]|uniref:AAA family ATPase n=1 Tax=Thiothrix fructosivorans TaxID=111770 RepID=A0A8B0SIJ4_9GAMM|nr:AAA family ATPase [Thiothrix fructosivorans]MBO0613902.1 AAA family ATPase [Thiothrix fructosivorans]QTX10270.1 AAA family ATPase [Thiothrix fructosivorans]